MKLCFSTLGCTEWSLEEILAVARKYEIEALEIRGIDGEMDNRKIEVLKDENTNQTTALWAQHHVTPWVLGTSCAFHTLEKYQAAMNEGKAAIDIAARLSIPYIRVFGNNLVGESEEERRECMARVSQGIGELCSYASNTNVSVLLEVHGDYNKIETLDPVVKPLANHPHFGIIWDIAHTSAYREEWPQFYQTFRSLIRHVHIKDRLIDRPVLTLPGEGELPILPIVRTMLNDGYSGCFSLEWEKKWHPELPAFREALACFVSLMKQI